MALDPNKQRRRFPWLILNVAICGLWLFVPAIRRSLRSETCMGNLEMVAGATLMYSVDNDDRMPPSATWMDATFLYTRDARVYGCPEVDGRSSTEFGHAYSSKLSLRRVSSVGNLPDTPLLFDSSDLRWNAAGALSLLPREPRNEGTHAIAFMDGTLRSVTAFRAKSLTVAVPNRPTVESP